MGDDGQLYFSKVGSSSLRKSVPGIVLGF